MLKFGPDNTPVVHLCSFIIVYLPWARFLPMGSLDLTCRAGGLHFQSLNGPYTLPKFDIFNDHILVSGSRQPRSPGTCSIHTSKCCSHHYSPLLSLLASTHPCQTPGIGSIALSGPLGKKMKKNLCGQGISLCTVSWIAWFLASTMSKNVPSGWAFGSPSCGFFCQTNSDTGCKCSSNSVQCALANSSYRFMMSWIQSVLLKVPIYCEVFTRTSH